MRTFDRRKLLIRIAALLVASVASPLASHAQQYGKTRRIGFLSLDTADSEAGQLAQQVFPEALRKFGYFEPNLVIAWRWGNGKSADLAQLAAELVRSNVELIVARTNASIEAAMKATKTIPIVMLNGNFPVERGFVESLARPGRNVTGTSYLVSTEIFEKLLQILKELAPRTNRIAVLRNANLADSPANRAMEDVLVGPAMKLGMTVHYFDVRVPQDIGPALDAIAASGIKAMLYRGDPIFRTRTAELMAFLREHRVASIAVIPTFAEAGGLVHYSPDGRDFYDRTASFVDRILKGARPSELPVEEPAKYEFVINLKTARLLGITVPQSVLLRATKLIE